MTHWTDVDRHGDGHVMRLFNTCLHTAPSHTHLPGTSPQLAATRPYTRFPETRRRIFSALRSERGRLRRQRRPRRRQGRRSLLGGT